MPPAEVVYPGHCPRWPVWVKKDPKVVLSRPSINEAETEPGDKQRLKYYEYNSDIHASVKDTYLQIGDTVKLYWFGRAITVGSKLQTVSKKDETLTFTVPRYEVVDVIAANASVWYTVRRPPSIVDIRSTELELIVDDAPNKEYTLDAPKIDSSHEKLTVARKEEFTAETTVEVRCIGKEDESDVWESRYLKFENNKELVFTIDTAWRERNKGKKVKFCSSFRISPNATPTYLLSQILRVNELKSK